MMSGIVLFLFLINISYQGPVVDSDSDYVLMDNVTRPCFPNEYETPWGCQLCHEENVNCLSDLQCCRGLNCSENICACLMTEFNLLSCSSSTPPEEPYDNYVIPVEVLIMITVCGYIGLFAVLYQVYYIGVPPKKAEKSAVSSTITNILQGRNSMTTNAKHIVQHLLKGNTAVVITNLKKLNFNNSIVVCEEKDNNTTSA